MKKWTVYQVVNRVNGRRYIGVHKTGDPNDSYMGSGKLIKYAVTKHGQENFSKEVLLVTDSKAEAYSLEASLVTKDALESGELYNLKEGGEGGWDFCNSVVTEEQKIRRAKRGNAVRTQKFLAWALDPAKKAERTTSAKKAAETRAKRGIANNLTTLGKKWVTDGVRNKFVLPDCLPEGWRFGITRR